MTARYILAAIAALPVLLLVLVLLCPAAVRILYTGGLPQAELRLLGLIRIRLYPRPDAKRKKKKKQAEKKEGKPDAQPPSSAQRLLGTLRTVNDLLPEAAKTAGWLLSRIRLTECVISLEIGKDEAADTAIAVGRANAIAHAAAATLANFIRVEDFSLLVRPNFLTETERGEARAVFQITPIVLLIGAVRFLWRYLRLQSGARQRKKRRRQSARAASGKNPANSVRTEQQKANS